MTGKSRLPAVAAILIITVAAAVALYLWLGREERAPLPEPQKVNVPDSIPVEKVAVQSPDLDVELRAMRGTVKTGYTDWMCLLECRERDGCRADVEVKVEYRSLGQPRQLTLGGHLEGKPGQIMRLGRAQRPPIEVDGIDRVTINVLRVYAADEPVERIIND
jgi:hypothetical protein